MSVWVELLHADLLGRHVGRRADAGHLRGLEALALLEGGAEVAHLGLAVLRQQDVPRLDVAVDDAVVVRVLERADALEDDLDHLADRQQAGDARVRLEGHAGNVFHHQVAALGLDHRVVDVDDVRMVELAGERGLGHERLVLHPLGLGVGALARQQHLDRHVPVGERIAREVDAAGRAAADLAQHGILADRLLQLELQARRCCAICCSSSDSW